MTNPKEERCLSLYTPTKKLKKTNTEKRKTRNEKRESRVEERVTKRYVR